MVRVLTKAARVVVRTIADRAYYLSEREVLEAKRPRDVGCEITNVCNANCSFCGYGKGPRGTLADPRKKSKLDETTLRQVLRLYSDAGGGVFQLGPILGENTVHPRWLEFVRIARSYPHISGVSCFTNGILLDRFGFDSIVQSGITNMIISTCLTSRERYRELYGVDKYDVVVTNIRGLLKANHAGGNPISILLALRIDKPYKTFFDSPLCQELSAYIPRSRMAPLEHEWDDFRGIIKEADLPDGHTLKPNPTDKTKPCYALFRKLQVMQNGDIQACSCRVEPELWAGSIMDYETIEAAWRNPRLEKLRTDWQNGIVPSCCQQCTHYSPYDTLVTSSRQATITTARAGVRRVLKAIR